MSDSSIDMLRNMKRSTDFINNYHSNVGGTSVPEPVKMEAPVRAVEPTPKVKDEPIEIKKEDLIVPTWPESKILTGCQEPTRPPIRKPKAKSQKTKQDIPKETQKMEPEFKGDSVDALEMGFNAIKDDEVGAKNYTIPSKNVLDKPRKPKTKQKTKPKSKPVKSDMLQCGKCGELKNKNEYYKSKLRLPAPTCKSCMKRMSEEAAIGLFPLIRRLLRSQGMTPPQIRREHKTYTETYYRNVMMILYKKGYLERKVHGRTHKYFLKKGTDFQRTISNSAEKYWPKIRSVFEDGQPHSTDQILKISKVVYSDTYLKTILKELVKNGKLKEIKFNGLLAYCLPECDLKMIEKIPRTEDTVMPIGEFLSSILDLADFEGKFGGRVIIVYCSTEDSFFEVYKNAKKTSYKVTIDATSKEDSYKLKLAHPGTETGQVKEEKASA